MLPPEDSTRGNHNVHTGGWDITVHQCTSEQGNAMTVPNRSPKVAVVITQKIIQDALNRGLGPGDFLPPEKAMLEEYQIGRGTLREALRLLEFQGVVTMKPGPGGGPMLLSPDASFLGSAIVLLMQLKDAPLKAIFDARTAIEPIITRLAASNIGDDTLEELKAVNDQMRDSPPGDKFLFLEANKKFHDIIAWSSGNPLLGYFADALLGVTNNTIVGIDFPARRRQTTLASHEAIYDALKSHDPTLSYDEMSDHIDEYTKYAERKFPDVMRSVVRWDRAL